jgi:hypothetical protein
MKAEIPILKPIKLLLIENLLFIFVTRYFFGCKAYQITWETALKLYDFRYFFWTLTPRLQFLCSTCRQLVQHPAAEITCLSVNGDQTIAYSELTIEMPDLCYFGRHFVFCSKKVSEIIQFQCRFSSNLIGLTAKEISGNKDAFCSL